MRLLGLEMEALLSWQTYQTESRRSVGDGENHQVLSGVLEELQVFWYLMRHGLKRVVRSLKDPLFCEPPFLRGMIEQGPPKKEAPDPDFGNAKED